MQFLYMLESMRTPALDAFFSAVTQLGDETFFLAVPIIIFWCIDKKLAYYLLSVGFAGLTANQFLKITCQVPRPWVLDSDFTIVESAREAATGYSFPSGHTQNITAVLGTPAYYCRKAWLTALALLLIALVALSRMYLGVHTPADVLTSLALTGALIYALAPIFCGKQRLPKQVGGGLLCVLAVAAAYLIFVISRSWPADIDAANLHEAVKNGWLLLGATAALLLSFHIERKYIRFIEAGRPAAQVVKVLFGLLLVVALKAGLKAPLLALTGGHECATAIRYGLLVFFAVCIWPLSFRWLSRGHRARNILIALLVLVLLFAGLFWAVTRDTTAAPIATDDAANPLITPLGVTMLSGHRAGGGIAPENTLMALQNCVTSEAYQLDIFEFDFHLTADNIPVLLHDATLDRTSDAVAVFGRENVLVSELTYEQLQQLNMGANFTRDDGSRPYADLSGDAVPQELRILSLADALTYLEQHGEYGYIIEIKDSGERGTQAADILYTTLSDFGCLQRTVVGTFNNEVTAYMDATYPDMQRSAGVNEVIRFYLYSLLGLPADAEDFNFVALQIPTTDYVINLGTSRVVNYAHKHDIAVQYWTINDVAEMARLQAIGADAIMTDVPDQAAGVLIQP
ncbi:MAG: phosphatase PAP2 family protein [Firmicutes bacterium]|nr:phosphatase PAP2 family protein [Bacillota bacterium]